MEPIVATKPQNSILTGQATVINTGTEIVSVRGKFRIGVMPVADGEVTDLLPGEETLVEVIWRQHLEPGNYEMTFTVQEVGRPVTVSIPFTLIIVAILPHTITLVSPILQLK